MVRKIGCALLATASVLAAGAAGAALTVTPITWNVVGLDSNNPASGPRYFPVGARVCSTTPTTNVAVNLVWDSANAFIGTRPGSLTSIAIPTLAAGACTDAYFEVEVAQTPAAFDTARRYHISAADGTGTVTTPMPRELYVEHLVSQARNEVSDVKLNGASVPPGGTMTLLVGGTYDITLVGATATQGYNQLESFINFPNTIFRVLAVNTTYTADSSNFVSSPNDRLYADACGWENHPSSPNYRSCVGVGGVGSDGKAGGGVVTTYTVQIVSGAGTTQTLNTLIYDFSGSSFHYNGDYAVGARFAEIVAPVTPTFGKKFAPSAITPSAQSTLTFSIGNGNSAALANVGFVDILPAGVSIPNNPPPVVSGCGGASVNVNLPAATITVTGATVAANGSCTISIPVTAAAAGTYNNTTQPLSVNGTNTGLTASATLGVAASAPGTGLCGITMAQWSFGTAGAPTLVPSLLGPGVGTATIISGSGLTVTNDLTTGSPAAASLRAFGWPNAGPVNVGSTDFFQFTIDTDSYSSVAMSFNGNRASAGPTNIEIWYSVDGGTTWSQKTTTAVTFNNWLPYGPYAFTSAQINPTGNTLFRIYGYGANNQNSGADLLVDNLTFTGCGVAQQPTLTKAFSPNPITVNGTSTLTFTLTNPNSAPLTSAAFFDQLPTGVVVASTASAVSTCGGPPSWAPTAGVSALSFSAGTIPANGSCTASVNVTATSTGAKLNISDFISTAESGTNATGTGAATATLNVNAVVLPPVAAKSFAPASIAPGQTSILSATIVNPNGAQTLTGIQLVDLYPGDLVNANPLAPPATNTCGGTLTATAGGNGFSLTGATLAPGTSCSIDIPVTAAAVGAKVNTTGAVQSVEGGPGNQATATLSVVPAAPAISLSKKVRVSPAGPWLDAVVVAPGTLVDYQFIVENVGNVPFASFSVSDPLLASAGANPSGCAWQTSNVPSVLPALPVASATLDPTATCVRGPVSAVGGIVQNIATATGVYNGNSYSTTDDANYLGADPNLSLTKEISTSPAGPWSASIPSIAAGASVHYRLTIANNGALDVSGISVTDPMVSTATCSYVDPLPPASASVCVVGPVTTAGAPGATRTNTATVNGSSGGSPVSDTGSASYTLTPPSADVSIVKTLTTPAPFVAGQSVAYTLVVANAGPDTATNVQVTDTPSNLTLASVSGGGCAALPCTISSLASGASATINVTATINAAGAFDNAATATAAETDPVPANNTDNSGNGGTAAASADVSMVKTLVTAGPFTAGQSIGYTLVVANAGPSTATNVQVTDTPSNLTVTNVSGGGCAALPCTIPSLASGASATINVTATINATGAFDNAATATAVETDPVPGNNTDSTGNGGTAATPSADLSITKTDGVATSTPGGSLVYTIIASNAGPNGVVGATVADTFPAVLTGVAWTCVGAGGGTCPANGTGNIGATVNLPVGGSVTFTANATLAGSATGTLTNTATVAPPGGVTDPNPANNSATDVNTIVLPTADLSVTKSNNAASVTTGTATSYVIRVTNNGPDTVAGAVLSDPEAPGLTKAAIVCSPTPGACVTPPTVAELEGLGFALPVLASGGFHEIVITANVTAPAGGSVTNTVTIAAPAGVIDGNPSNNVASDTDPVVAAPAPVADLAVTKSNGTTQVTAGQPSTYTMVITNIGPDAAPNVTLTDALPAQLTFNSVTAPAGWSCTTPAVGVTGTVSCSATSMATSATATFVLSVTVAPATPGGSTISNTVNVASGASDPVLGNNQATDTDSVVAAPVTADLAITKSNGTTQLVAGGSTNYAVTVTNLGPGEVTGAIVADVAPTGLAFGPWTCTVTNPGSGGSVTTACATGSGVGNVNATVDLKAGAVVTFSVAATVASNASGSISNTATVNAPSGVTDPVLGNNTATDTDSIAAVPARVVEVPTLSEWALLVLSLLLATVAMRQVRAGRR